MPDDLPEPWLRGPLAGVHPLLTPPIHALMQAREDLRRHVQGLSAEEIWSRPSGVTSLGFHLRHIAGSLDRLTSYLVGRELTAEQHEFLRRESESGAGAAELLHATDAAIERASEAIRGIDPARLADARTVGRKRLPTTVIGLAMHLAEHTQRHVGQAITMAMLVKGLSAKKS